MASSEQQDNEEPKSLRRTCSTNFGMVNSF
jgi:hypothetical protein